jgi:hypothetical protein
MIAPLNSLQYRIITYFILILRLIILIEKPNLSTRLSGVKAVARLLFIDGYQKERGNGADKASAENRVTVAMTKETYAFTIVTLAGSSHRANRRPGQGDKSTSCFLKAP